MWVINTNTNFHRVFLMFSNIIIVLIYKKINQYFTEYVWYVFACIINKNIVKIIVYKSSHSYPSFTCLLYTLMFIFNDILLLTLYTPITYNIISTTSTYLPIENGMNDTKKIWKIEIPLRLNLTRWIKH